MCVTTRPPQRFGALGAVRWSSHSTTTDESKVKRRAILASGLPFARYAEELTALEQLPSVPANSLPTIISEYAAAGKHEMILARLRPLVPRLRGGAGAFGLIIKALQDVRGSVEVAFAVMHQAATRPARSKTDKATAPDARAYHCLIGVCARQGDYTDALRVGQLMDDNRVAFTSGTYDCLINACARSLTDKLDSALVGVDSVAGANNVDTGARRHPGLDAAFALLDDMRQQRGLEPDRRIYCSLMRVCLSYGDVARMRRTFDDMRQRAGIAPDIYAFNFLMQGCAVERDLGAAMRVLADMKLARVAPVTITYNMILNLCAETAAAAASESADSVDSAGTQSVDSLAAAEQVLARMEQSRLAPPDQVTFNTLLKACANAAASRSAAGAAAVGGFVEALDKATAYVAAMKARDIDPDVYTYNTLLQVCSHCPRPWKRTTVDDADTGDDAAAAEHGQAAAAARVDKVVEEVMREMNERGVRPDGATVTLLISHFGAREDPARAFAVLSDMKRANIKPYLPSFTALITACRHYSDPAMAEQMALTALDELKTAGLTPTAAVMNAFMAVTPQRAPKVLAMMRDHNIEPTESTWNQLIYSVAWRLKSESDKNESGNENETSRELELLEEAFASADRLQQSSGSGPASVAYGYLLEACLYAAQRISARRESTTGTGVDADEDVSGGQAVLSADDRAELQRVAQLADRCWRDMLAHQPTAITREACAVRMRLCLRSASRLDPADAAEARAGLQGAIEAYGEMRRRGFLPSPLTYGALARTCARHGAFERVTQLVEDMRAQGVQPSTATLGATAQALTSSRSAGAAAALAALRDLVLPKSTAAPTSA